MKLSTKGRYAVSSMIDIAKHAEESCVSLVCISKRNNISVPYLEQLFIKLRRANLVVSSKGAKGGYVLSRKPSEITVLEVMQAVGEKIDMLKCNHKKNCITFADNKMCSTHDLWDNLLMKIYSYLGSLTLQDVLDSNNKNNVSSVFEANLHASINTNSIK
jgi:Rrf2 family iron-sulfur cluster assembly transcriptional regulator